MMYDPTTTGTSNTGTSGCYPYTNNCIHRLPCGLCTLLRTLCPLGTVGINWNNVGEVTCQTAEEGE